MTIAPFHTVVEQLVAQHDLAGASSQRHQQPHAQRLQLDNAAVGLDLVGAWIDPPLADHQQDVAPFASSPGVIERSEVK